MNWEARVPRDMESIVTAIPDYSDLRRGGSSPLLKSLLFWDFHQFHQNVILINRVKKGRGEGDKLMSPGSQAPQDSAMAVSLSPA